MEKFAIMSIAKCLSGVGDDVKGSCFARVDGEGAKGWSAELGKVPDVTAHQPHLKDAKNGHGPCTT